MVLVLRSPLRLAVAAVLLGCSADAIPELPGDAAASADLVDATTPPTDLAVTPTDASRLDASDATPPLDARFDARIDAPAIDARAPLDAVSPPVDAAPSPACDARFAFNPTLPGDNAPFDVRFTDATGWAYIGLDFSGPATPSWAFVDVVTRSPFTWLFRVQPTRAGRYTVTFTADNGARRLGACTFDVAARGGTPDAAAPPDATSSDVTTPTGVFVTRAGSEFTAGGARFRFVGANSAGLPHYGAAPLMYARVDQIAAELDELHRMGARVVRVFAAADDAAPDAVAARLGRVLDLAAARGIWVIAALTDFYASTPYHPRGDRSFYARDPRFSIDLLSPDFFRAGYRVNYLPWARAVVSRFASHPALFAWELGNEIKCDDDHRAFIAFARDVSDAIRALDRRHMITTGMITSRWATDAEARELYGLPNVDFVTFHNYNGTGEFADSEYAVARDTDRPLIVEEAGFDAGDRPTRVDADLRSHVDARGARGYMQWGFTAITPDNGNGDRQFGMDRLFHASDYDGLFRVYGAAASRYR